MKIGILTTGHVPGELTAKHGEYPAMFERLLDGHGFTFEAYAVVDNVFPASVESCDAWLITGSRHGAYEDHPWIPPLENFIREAYSRGVPVAGICFGHQIMAQALGGKVEKYSGGWGLGKTVYRTSDGGETTLLALHQDQVVKRPPDAEVICSSDFCEFAGFAYKGKALSFQPHPEFSPDYVRDIIGIRRGAAIPEPVADAALAILDDDVDAPDIAGQIAEFFKSARQEKAA